MIKMMMTVVMLMVAISICADDKYHKDKNPIVFNISDSQEKADKVDNFDTYKNYQSEKGFKFSIYSESEKVYFVNHKIEMLVDEFYNTYKLGMELAAASKVKNDLDTLDEKYVEIAIKYLELTSSLAKKHLNFIDKNMSKLSTNDASQLKIYRAKIVKIYLKRRILSK